MNKLLISLSGLLIRVAFWLLKRTKSKSVVEAHLQAIQAYEKFQLANYHLEDFYNEQLGRRAEGDVKEKLTQIEKFAKASDFNLANFRNAIDELRRILKQ